MDALPQSTRGFHPLGAADPSGFAAMACCEILVHTHNTATDLGEQFRLDAELARAVPARLFPRHAPGTDAWVSLLWAHGRLDLPGAPSQQGWRWHTAPPVEGPGGRA